MPRINKMLDTYREVFIQLNSTTFNIKINKIYTEIYIQTIRIYRGLQGRVR